ncbi:MAG: Gfo/Idh/MocA family oxidoreductase, partial [Balneolaceae bacterium]
RVHPSLIELKKKLTANQNGKRHKIKLSYITSRGLWYHYSWKGDEEKSGGIGTNIGVHFFDMLMWLFGPAQTIELYVREKNRMGGFLELPNADVEWFLSLEPEDIPNKAEGQTTFRSISVDEEEIEFSGGFTDLHTRVYEETVAGNGFSLEDARPSIELVHKLRTMPLKKNPSGLVHPSIEKLKIKDLRL